MGKDLKGKELGKGITQRADGRYQARYTDKYGERRTIYSRKISDIKKMLRDAQYEDEYGLSGNGISLTLNEWFEAWMKLYKEKKVGLKTQQTLRATYNSRVRDSIGNMYLKDIKTYHIQKFLNDLLDIGFNISTVSNFKILLNNMLRHAMQNDYITKNPCVGVELPQIKTVESRVLTLDEQRQFFDFADKCAHINVFKFALLTGMRIGEAIGLTWADIDFENRVIDINKTLHYGDARSDRGYTFFYTSTKTEASKRKLPMGDELCSLLMLQKEHKARAKFRNKGLWKPREGFEDLVFVGTKGQPLKIGTLNEAIRGIVQKINVYENELATEENREPKKFKHFTCHTFRHTFTTRCYEQGVPDKVIQKLLGHANIETTLNIYTHASDESKEQAMANIKIMV